MGTENSNEQAGFNNYNERCDVCIARAQERVTKGELELFFCRHHFAVHATALADGDWTTHVPQPVVSEDTKEPALV